MFDSDFQEHLTKLGLSLLIGLLIGGEREYRNKSAGLRTIMLICLGSTIFTIVSLDVSHDTEVGRIASNIVTGIGFLGAGAILRDGLTVAGLTTASTVWVAAALGMAVGYGEYELAISATFVVLIILIGFSYFQKWFDRVHKMIELRVSFNIEHNGVADVVSQMKTLNLSFERRKERREEGIATYEYSVSGKAKDIETLIAYLISQKEQIRSFDY
jgi:putative Mg2+ transporter-C (MgtC) family protein